MGHGRAALAPALVLLLEGAAHEAAVGVGCEARLHRAGGLRGRGETVSACPRRPIDWSVSQEFYRAREHLPAPPHAHARRAVGLMINHWFEIRRPGATAPLFPRASLRSAVMIWLDSRRANLSIRYQTPELTPDLREVYAVGALLF